MTPQRRYQLDHLARGLCMQCQAPIADGSRFYCDRHLVQHRERCRISMRKLRGCGVWKPGGRGRPPINGR